MLRFFISPHPTFKSYKAPDKERVEKSPYYWWWYALTLNSEYVELCEQKSDGILLTDNPTETEQKMREVYADFGDVRYEGDRYKAFCDWWRAPVSTGERRGEFLFAEPVHTSTVSVLDSLASVESALTSDDTLVVSIPLNRQRQHVDKAIDKLLKRHMKVEKGRTARNPRSSKARYSLSMPAVPDALRKSFELYTAKRDAEINQVKRSNVELARLTNLNYTERLKSDGDSYDFAAQNRAISVIVSRHISKAKDMVNNVKYGYFP